MQCFMHVVLMPSSMLLHDPKAAMQCSMNNKAEQMLLLSGGSLHLRSAVGHFCLLCREARVMDTIAQHLRQLSSHVAVPRSVPGLVSKRLMVMTFMEGLPLMQLKDKVAHLPQWKREKVGAPAVKRLCSSQDCCIVNPVHACKSAHLTQYITG